MRPETFRQLVVIHSEQLANPVDSLSGSRKPLGIDRKLLVQGGFGAGVNAEVQNGLNSGEITVALDVLSKVPLGGMKHVRVDRSRWSGLTPLRLAWFLGADVE